MAKRDNPRSGTTVLALLVLAAVALITLDARGHASPIDPARSAVGAVVGPVESLANGAVRPFRSVARALHTNTSLRHDVATLQSQNSELRNQLATSSVDRNRLAEYDGLVGTARDTG